MAMTAAEQYALELLNRARLDALARAWPDRVPEERKDDEDAGDGRTGRN